MGRSDALWLPTAIDMFARTKRPQLRSLGPKVSFPPHSKLKFVAAWYRGGMPVRAPMVHRLVGLIAVVFGSLIAVTPNASAHPHVWVTMRSELLYAPDGSVTAVRHAWTFDDMFSAFATTGLQKVGGTFTRETLQPLAKVNVDTLKEYRYFTSAKVNGRQQKGVFGTPTEYWAEYDPKEAVVILHFTLPFKKPIKAKSLEIDVYDPEFFIDFGFAKNRPVTLVGAPAQCKVATGKPPDSNFPSLFFKLDPSMTTSEANIGMGASFANRIWVNCP
jgi:ABC-type uncharacterized transport system substrate-binding protein